MRQYVQTSPNQTMQNDRPRVLVEMLDCVREEHGVGSGGALKTTS